MEADAICTEVCPGVCPGVGYRRNTRDPLAVWLHSPDAILDRRECFHVLAISAAPTSITCQRMLRLHPEVQFRFADHIRRDLSIHCQNAIEHRSGLAGIDSFKALRERAVDPGEFIVGFRSSSALRQKPRKPCTAS